MMLYGNREQGAAFEEKNQIIRGSLILENLPSSEARTAVHYFLNDVSGTTDTKQHVLVSL